MLPQRRTGVLRAKRAALLEQRHDLVSETVEAAWRDVWHKDEAVTGTGFDVLDECRRDAEIAKSFGFHGKWTGIPAQTQIALDVFSMGDDVINEAIEAAKAFLQAEKEGRGAVMIKGKMSDRATDRIYRVALKVAYALGRIDEVTAKELHLA